MHTNHSISFHAVIDGKWEALGEATAMTVDDLMNSGVNEKGINCLRISSLGSRSQDRLPGLHKNGNPGSNHPGLRPEARFSRELVSDVRFGGLPINESRLPLGEPLAAFIEDVFVPGRGLNRLWGTGEVFP